MSKNPLTLKIAAPYAQAMYDYAIKENIIHQTSLDIQNLEAFLKTNNEFNLYLKNPLITNSQKQEILDKILRNKIKAETFKFLTVLVKRDRINLLDSIIQNYFELMYKSALINIIEVQTAFSFNNGQKNKLNKKLKELTNSREIRLIIKIDASLIGGFLIKTQSKKIDFTIKNKLQKLSKHLDSVLDI